MIRFASLQKPYDFFVSIDPAFKQAPAEPIADASDEDKKAYQLAVDEYLAKLSAARKTGNWTELLIEGETPTKFVLDQVHRPTWRALMDRATLPHREPRHVGQIVLQMLLFRLSVIEIPALGPFERKPDPQWDGWVMAPSSLVDQIDRTDPAIVGEIGLHVFNRLQEIDPL